MLPSVAASALAAHRRRQETERELAGSRWVETGMVFTTGIGTMLDARSLLKAFYTILKTSTLPRVRFHDLRHSAATLLLAQGVHPRVRETLHPQWDSNPRRLPCSFPVAAPRWHHADCLSVGSCQDDTAVRWAFLAMRVGFVPADST
jgi:hypothetical protein